MKYKFYIKQAIRELKNHKMINAVIVIGAALAICMIMVVIIAFQVRMVDCAPEVNRSRSLYMKYITIRDLGSSNSATGMMSLQTAKSCFKSLERPEAVSILSFPMKARVGAIKGKSLSCDLLETDATFWSIFDFQFIKGSPYTSVDVESGLPKVVISSRVSQQLYGTTDVVGRTLMLNMVNYTISGVVKDVSRLASASYAQIWVPYTSTETTRLVWWESVMGMMRVVILARSADDFAAIRSEVEQKRLLFNRTLEGAEIVYEGQPDTQLEFVYRRWMTNFDIDKIVGRLILILLILLLVPAINLSSMTLSRMQKRMPEFGLRKAFGATKNHLLRQIFLENMVLNLLAGILGLILSYVSIYFLRNYLFLNSENYASAGQLTLSMEMLFNPYLFLIAFLFVFILNVLSAIIPVYRVAKVDIVDALNRRK